MKLYNRDMPSYSRLYGHINEFKKFNDIDENRLNEIYELVKHFKSYEKSCGYKGYEMAINYLTNLLKICFDEKIAFLIMCCDYDLIHFNDFIRTPIISKYEIESLENDDDINLALIFRKKQLQKLKKSIEETIGFFDFNLVSLEFIFFQKFYSDKVLVDGVHTDLTHLICEASSCYNTLNNLNQEKKNQLIKGSNNYLNYIKENNKKIEINSLLFNIFYQSDLLGLMNDTERLFFFISTIDRECKALNYLNDNSIFQIENIVGFYDDKFMKAEKVYKKKYLEN